MLSEAGDGKYRTDRWTMKLCYKMSTVHADVVGLAVAVVCSAKFADLDGTWNGLAC